MNIHQFKIPKMCEYFDNQEFTPQFNRLGKYVIRVLLGTKILSKEEIATGL